MRIKSVASSLSLALLVWLCACGSEFSSGETPVALDASMGGSAGTAGTGDASLTDKQGDSIPVKDALPDNKPLDGAKPDASGGSGIGGSGGATAGTGGAKAGAGGSPPECQTKAQCDDTDPCTVDTCASGVCHHNAMDCNDSKSCTDDSCNGGTCSNVKNCDDSNECTDDYCNGSGNCESSNNSNPCGGGHCSGGNCVQDPQCTCPKNASTPCTDSCDKPCNEGKACVTNASCQSGVCQCKYTTCGGYNCCPQGKSCCGATCCP